MNSLTRPPIEKRHCDRREASCSWSIEEFALTIRSESQACADIFCCKLWKVRLNLIKRHSTRKIFKYIRHGDAQAADTRFAIPLTRFDGNNVLVVHGSSLSFDS